MNISINETQLRQYDLYTSASESARNIYTGFRNISSLSGNANFKAIARYWRSKLIVLDLTHNLATLEMEQLFNTSNKPVISHFLDHSKVSESDQRFQHDLCL